MNTDKQNPKRTEQQQKQNHLHKKLYSELSLNFIAQLGWIQINNQRADCELAKQTSAHFQVGNLDIAFSISKTVWSLGYQMLSSVAELEDLSHPGGFSHPLECSVHGCCWLQLECKSWDRLKHTQLCHWCICQSCWLVACLKTATLA